MNRRRPRKLRRLQVRPKEPRLEPKPGDPDQRWALAKALKKRAFAIASLTSGVTIIIALGLFFLIKAVNTRAKPSQGSQVTAVTKPPTPIATEKVAKENSPAPKKLDSAQSEMIVATGPSPAESPSPTPTAIASTALSPESTPQNSDQKPRELTEAQRRTVELKRRAAERKRSRLETMHQRHEISDEAYKKGQDEYRNAMAKYRNALNGSDSASE